MSGIDVLKALPVPVYTTDAEGRITFYNEAAAEFWGHRPELGSDLWCGSWRLYWPNGEPLSHDQCPMAVTLREGREVRDVEAVAERPDGTRVSFMPYPSLLRDGSGHVVGAINLLVDIAERKRSEIDLARLAAIVASSDDAIVSKSLDGQVTSWNAGAARIFGYEPDEMIGQPIKRIIPAELHEEEDEILAKIRRGEHIDHYDTTRLTKDGRRVAISLTVSPLRDRSGKVIGASKVARDITDRKRSDELQRLLFDELNHRVKNTLATIQAIASQSLLNSKSPRDFVESFNGRVQALARAHDLLVRREMKGADLGDIIHEQVVFGEAESDRISCSGPFLTLDAKLAIQLALILHELATNARKYGALAVPTGKLTVTWDTERRADTELFIRWTESGVPEVRVPTTRGFGTSLIERTLAAHGGETTMRYEKGGVVCEIRLPLPEHSDPKWIKDIDSTPARPDSGVAEYGVDLRGKRILLVEDEALVAMDIEAHLAAEGCEVIGPAGTIERARQLVREAAFDAVLLDANLGGHSVEELAVTLTQSGIPFAFATGYGRVGLPEQFRHRAVLTKPFGREEVTCVLRAIIGPIGKSPDVVSLRGRRSQ